MHVRQKNLWLLVAILFAICLTIFMLSDIVIHPQHSMMEVGGDGGKNYLSWFYHIMYEKGTWFYGMNYPYGEHIVYADGQALLSVPLSYINKWMPMSNGTILAIMNLCIGFSYVLGIVYSWKILVHFRVAPWAAIIFAGLIISLSPQVTRIGGHYALAMMCFVPMLFYWFILYNEQGKLRYMIYVFLLATIMSFEHPYFGGLAFIWVAMYTVGCLVLYKTRPIAKIRHILPPVICVVAMYAVIQIFMHTTDPVHDRPVYPYGALQTVTEFPLIVTSGYSPIWTHIGTLAKVEFPKGGEGYIYVGLVAAIVFAVSLIIGIVRLVRKKHFSNLRAARRFPAIWFFVAFGTLILALGIPFVWGMDDLYEHMSVLRQFRALGRFGWIFYYIITVYAVVMLYGWYARALVRQKKIWAYTVLFIPMLVWAWESSAYIKFTRDIADGSYDKYKYFFATEDGSLSAFLAEHQHKRTDFQAMILLPFIHVGSEKLWLHESAGWMVTLGAKAAVQQQIPIVNVLMSRTSLSQTEKQVRTVGGPFTDKPLMRDGASNKPFLIMRFEGDSIDVDQQYLLRNSDYIGHYSQCFLYACYPQTLLASDKHYADSARAIAKNMHGSDTVINATGSWYINHFDTGTSVQKLFGAAGKPSPMDGKAYIAQVPIKPADTDREYELSVWVLMEDKDFRGPAFVWEMDDSAGVGLASVAMPAKTSTDNKGLWFRVSGYYKIPAHTALLKCRVMPSKHLCYFAIDEMMVRPTGTLIISRSADGKIMANTHLLP